VKNEIEVFREYVRKKGLRNTPEREIIITEIFSTHDHFDVDELYLRLQNKKKKVSKPSIYRTIPHLLEAGLIQEAYFEDGHQHYEHIYGHEHHCHLRCVKCGKTIEFTEPMLKKLEAKLAKKFDFAVGGHKLEVTGFCSKCNAHRDPNT
jgi:Fur family ferric uptake transcriptional regulator